MAKFGFFLTIVLLFVFELSLAADSPAPAPSLGADSSPQLAPTPMTSSPHSASSISPVTTAASPPAPEPMAPYPSNLELGISPASSPAPSPSDAASNINHSDNNAEVIEEDIVGDGGMSVGKKAGIVFAVAAAACLIGFVGLIYKKRQYNIRRSQYAYASSREIL